MQATAVRSLTAFLLGFQACACSFRHPPDRSGLEAHAPARMNRAFLGAEGPPRLVIQVDWIAGCRPEQAALDALSRWLARVEARPAASIEVIRGKEVPRQAGMGREGLVAAVEKNAHPPADAYFVYVLYWDRLERYRGVTFPAGELGPSIDFPVVTMLVRPIERDSVLWLTRRKVESAVLLHEMGHVAGLVTSGRQDGSGHCPNPRCRMYWGVDWASIRANCFQVVCLGRLPLYFCGDCERELAEGRASPSSPAPPEASPPPAPSLP